MRAGLLLPCRDVQSEQLSATREPESVPARKVAVAHLTERSDVAKESGPGLGTKFGTNERGEEMVKLSAGCAESTEI